MPFFELFSSWLQSKLKIVPPVVYIVLFRVFILATSFLILPAIYSCSVL